MSFFIVQASENYTAITETKQKTRDHFPIQLQHLQLWQKEASTVRISFTKQKKLAYIGVC
jgi:hypothetical protein